VNRGARLGRESWEIGRGDDGMEVVTSDPMKPWPILLCALLLGCLRRTEVDGAGGAGGGGGSADGGGGAGGTVVPVVEWEALDSGTTAALRSVWVGEGTAFVVGDAGTILRSDDRGASWQTVESATTDDLHAVWGVDGDVFAVGDAGRIVRSLAGEAFAAVDAGAAYDLRALWAGGGVVYAGGESSALLRSVDDGSTWEQLGTPAISVIEGIWSVDGSLFVVAEASLMTSTNLGDDFTYQILSVHAHTDVWAATAEDFFITNDGSVVTSWEVDHWLKTILTPTRALHAIWGSGLDDMLIVGQGGLILRSVDAGDDWALEESGTSETLHDVFGDAGLVLAVGNGGTILERP
jgi:photosystem II stability/assembly factor-like uncharacterized protein